MIGLANELNKHDIAKKLDKTLSLLKSKCTKVGIVGLSNSGKSTTINALLGDEYLPTSEMAESAYVLCIKHDPQSHSNPTLYDKTDQKDIAFGVDNIYEELGKLNEERRDSQPNSKREFELSVPQGLTDCTELEIYDTPGTSDGESSIREDAKQIREEVEGIILVLGVDSCQTYQADLLRQLEKYKNEQKEKRRILVLMNKEDLMYKNPKKIYTKEMLQRRAGKCVPVPWNEVVFYSAKCSLEGRQLKKLNAADLTPHCQLYRNLHGTVVTYSELEKEALKIPDCSRENIGKLAELAEKASNIAKVEEVVKESFRRFKVRKAIDDATHQVAQLLEHAKQQEDASSTVTKLEKIEKDLNGC